MHWYKMHFGTSDCSNLGEIAPTYFVSREACYRIKRLIPRAKIVCIFRHPVERILSLYRVKRAYGLIPWSFEEAVVHDAELMESSRYASHLRHWLRAFGTEQVLTTFYEDLRDHPQAYVDTLADFVGLPRFLLTDTDRRAIHASETMTHPKSYVLTHRATLISDWLKARGFGRLVTIVNGSPIKRLFLGGGAAFSQPSPETLQMLYTLMRLEVEELEGIVNRDLSSWMRRSIPLDLHQVRCRKAAA